MIRRLTTLTALLLISGPATVAADRATVRVDRLTVRTSPARNAPAAGHLQAGQVVEVLEREPRTADGTPASGDLQWVRIAWPATLPLWVATDHIDFNRSAVKPGRLNVRTGPGPSHRVVGQLAAGSPVRVVQSSNGWSQIEGPEAVTAYVAGAFLDPLPASASPTSPGPTPAVPGPAATNLATPTPAPEAPLPVVSRVVATGPAPVPADPLLRRSTVPPVPPPVAIPVTPSADPASLPVPTDPGQARGVVHDGMLQRARHLKAPARYELRSHRGEGVLNYLTTEDLQIDLELWVDKRVTVTGEEWVHPEWPGRPMVRVRDIRETF